MGDFNPTTYQNERSVPNSSCSPILKRSVRVDSYSSVRVDSYSSFTLQLQPAMVVAAPVNQSSHVEDR